MEFISSCVPFSELTYYKAIHVPKLQKREGDFWEIYFFREIARKNILRKKRMTGNKNKKGNEI
ncbi:hypothetical protein DXC33_03480 [Clostridiaceae bacterium TF01-6]|nr:hypothetical protein DXC33_03480 [Clostridiaceae bacterium TF01-6]